MNIVDAVSFLTGRKGTTKSSQLHLLLHRSFRFTTADSGQQESLINEAVLWIEEASKRNGLDSTTLITLISYIAGKYGGSKCM